MDKQFGTTNEMVIEMAKVIAKYISSRDFEVKFITNPDSKAFPFSHTAGVANDLYNAGYRKIPENAVVLTREEYEQIYGTVKAHGELLKDLQEAKSVFEKEMEEAQKEFFKQFEEHEQTIRKETAEKVFEELYNWLHLEEISKYGFVTIQKFDFLRKFRDLHKKLEFDEICKEITEAKE